MEYFDDSYVIYRNRPVFGAQFDVCLLAPNIGIIIFEVKAWKRDTILRVENGDRIVIKSFNEETQKEEEAFENPTDQARGYVYKMRQKVRTKTGKNPLIYEMVCFPNLTKQEYDDAGIEPVWESEISIVKEDLASKADFYAKMNIALKEVAETEYWLNLLYDTEYISTEQFDSIMADCLELLKLLTSITKKQKKI